MNRKEAARGLPGAAAAVALLVGTALPACAQTFGPLSLTPHAGAVVPAGEYGRIAANGANTGTYAAVVGDLPAAPALGAAAEFRLGESPFSLRAAGLWSFEASGQVTLDCADQPCPSLLVRQEVDTRVYALTGGVAYRPEAFLWSIQPVLSVGAGVRARRFRWEGLGDNIFSPGDFQRRDAVFQGSVGASRRAGPGEISVEVGDLMGRVGGATDGTRHDVTVSLGYRL